MDVNWIKMAQCRVESSIRLYLLVLRVVSRRGSDLCSSSPHPRKPGGRKTVPVRKRIRSKLLRVERTKIPEKLWRDFYLFYFRAYSSFPNNHSYLHLPREFTLQLISQLFLFSKLRFIEKGTIAWCVPPCSLVEEHLLSMEHTASIFSVEE
jgi:hypothetical protein